MSGLYGMMDEKHQLFRRGWEWLKKERVWYHEKSGRRAGNISIALKVPEDDLLTREERIIKKLTK